MSGTCSMHDVRNAYSYKVMVGKPNEIRPVRRPKCRWEDNIKGH
jgi:hypothetical protein